MQGSIRQGTTQSTIRQVDQALLLELSVPLELSLELSAPITGTIVCPFLRHVAAGQKNSWKNRQGKQKETNHKGHSHSYSHSHCYYQ